MDEEDRQQDNTLLENISQNQADQSYNLQNSISQKSDCLPERNINDNLCLDDEPYSAPVEVLSEFLSTLMARNYKSALYYCKLILLYEPENEIVQDFYPLIQEKMHLDNYDSEDCGTSDDSSSTQSESSTEYFSSTSVGTENMSSSISSEEDATHLE